METPSEERRRIRRYREEEYEALGRAFNEHEAALPIPAYGRPPATLESPEVRMERDSDDYYRDRGESQDPER
jgi:hypothetical protein